MDWFPSRRALVAAFWLSFGLWWATRAVFYSAGGALIDAALALAGFVLASYVLVTEDVVEQRDDVGAKDAMLAGLVVLSLGLVASALLFR